MDVQLVVQKGAVNNQTIRLHRTATIVGRRDGCDIRVPSAAVSRRHCLLRFQEDLLTVEDLKSANGTFVNGTRIRDTMVLRPGDVLQIGPVSFQVRYHLTQTAMDRLLDNPVSEVLEAIELGSVEELAVVEVEEIPVVEDLELIPVADDERLPDELPDTSQEVLDSENTEEHKPKRRPKRREKKTTAKKAPAKPAADNKKTADDETPDASLLFGKGRRWEMPEDKDLRDILSHLEE